MEVRRRFGRRAFYCVCSSNEEDFVCVTPYTYNLYDKVGININKDKIRLRLKKELSEYEA